MKALLILLSVSTLLFVSCFSQVESGNKSADEKKHVQSASLSVLLKPGDGVGFNVFDGYRRVLSLKNNSDRDSVVTKRLLIDKPLHLVYSNILVLPEAPLFRTYTVLLNPRDSVVLKQAVDGALVMHFSSGFPNFIDSLMSVPNDLGWNNRDQQQLLDSIGVDGLMQMIETFYKKNERVISNLDAPEAQADVLRSLNSNIKYTAIAHLLVDATIVRSRLTDSLYDDMYRHMDKVRTIDALNRGTIFGAVIAYNATLQNENLDKHDFWACAAEADRQLKQTAIYRECLTTPVITTFVNIPEEIPVLNKKLESIHTRDPFLDTLYQLTNILSETFTDFQKAKKDLKAFAGGRYNFIFEDTGELANHEMKTIRNLQAVDLYDFAGNKSDFKGIVMDEKYQLTVIDLWASWCVPCIGEMPYWEKMKEKFIGKPIRFMTISIDREEDIDKWVAVAKRGGIYDHPNQFRLADFKESPLTKLLYIRNIPRYLVINNAGDVVDDDFHRPSDSDFEFELLKLLN